MTYADLTFLDQYRHVPLPSGYPANLRVLYAPDDDIHAALLELVATATVSIQVAMYAFDDTALAAGLETAIRSGLSVQITLDSSQAAYSEEKRILLKEAYPAADIAIGTSRLGAIMHDKVMVVDGSVTVLGSTNWSHSGEALQDNHLVVTNDAVVASETAAELDAVHQWIVNNPAGS